MIGDLKAERKRLQELYKEPTDYGQCERFGCKGRLVEIDRYRCHMDSVVKVKCTDCGYTREFT